ncbi:GNAT family N-acetyltransferase [Rubrivirga litoralis]|uniref:GNAT family N-acetyltransferase n=1 Tax=Rubrivirga litoralis TaxID=3075598 RepID=A0ABU3BN52_9BACT|nr:GNAT family N-acetyltransferase [Rubrivirga sp. F394]MDT0630650.1 GNAT family N-acetyltransferase [Rubrivirga sp. F394]
MEARELDLGDASVRRAWGGVAEAADPSPFAPLAYAEATAGAFGLRARAFGVEQDGALVGGVVAYEKRRGPYRLAVVPPFTPVTPFVLAEAPAAHEVHARASPLDALVAAVGERFHAAAFRLPPALSDARPFAWAGWRAEPLYTYAGPLHPAAERLAQAGSGVRKRVRRGAGDFTLHEDAGGVAALQRLEAEAYARQGAAPPVDPERQAAWLGALVASGAARLFVLRDAEGGAAGAQAVATDGRAAAFVCGASWPGSAMTVMTHLVCDRLYADGVRSLDLVGANRPSGAEFKRSFGLPLVQQFRVTRVARPELRALALVRPVV